ncbi:response regulator receiver protein [Caldicellulosiruptor saccharolyticus DSM 8903]|uniref:Response regulator receiver protein n=1 Tax=Caldicellulosiruptor saccharolyticus (strain ATCC 43494 / DSM 8903 / Tp8T 6331) TaxID=351627 RepID=A4XJ47_CALS8|nr:MULTISPECIES: response regulator [Caldicellulosiruptor]ABP66932.1 response regulator receiver protein [Caldicellulosiruptor saccharolyticus DSM 8903]
MKKYTVLFVDDEENILSALKRALIDEEYRCLFAKSGDEALKILEKENVQVIVADMKMPEMDGLTLLKIVKQKYPKIVRVVLSGFTQLPQVLAAINQAGIFRFITKPWNVEEELKIVINQALEYYVIQEEKEQLTKTLEKRNEMYVNVLRATEKKFKELKQNFDVLRDIISYQDSYIIQLLKADRKKDIVIFLLENMKRTISNYISMLPIYPIKFNVEKLVRDLSKTIEERFEGNSNIKIEVKDETKEYTFEGFYGVLLFTLIEIMMVIIQFDLDAFAVISIDCIDSKLIIIISIPTKIEEKLLLYLLSLTPFASVLKGTLKIDTQKGKNIDIQIECTFDYVEKNIN